MAIKLYEETNIQNIANAIREKNGSTDTYKPSEMPEAIRAIPTGGGEAGIDGLPSGYARADFIQFTGKELIDTGIIGNQDT